jgi:anti-anti-sigma regulatory factor
VFVGYSESLRDVEQLEAQRAGDVVFYMRPVDDARTPVPVRTRTDPAIVVPTRTKTDPAIPVTPRPSRPIPDHDVLALTGTPDAQAVTQQIGERLAIGGLRRLVIDLDGADLLADELAPVLRRACAAGRAANIAVALRTTRPGARRWLSRHALPEEPS